MTPGPAIDGSRAWVVGAGPAGLMAAERLSSAGIGVDVLDAMPSAGRKFLLAGVGGLNLTHAEPLEDFIGRYGEATPWVEAWLRDCGPAEVRRWAGELGVPTFVGSSQRVFPVDLKAAPLLRAWLQRLRRHDVRLHTRWRWDGWADDGGWRFVDGRQSQPDAAPVVGRPRLVVLALGGASWSRLGSDGRWWPWLQARGVSMAPWLPSNAGVRVAWSDHLRQHHAGAALKNVRLTLPGFDRLGECVLTDSGLEGPLIYAATPAWRQALQAAVPAIGWLDLLPHRPAAWVAEAVAGRGAKSWPTHLKTRLKLDGAKAALLWERLPRSAWSDPAAVAAAIQRLPVPVTGLQPLDSAISTAGGVRREALDEHLMLRAMPGVFCCGEMLDWEAPTGGYLLTACLASGRRAGDGAASWWLRPSAG